MKKKIAVHAEDYDLAKQFKSQIQKLEKSLEPPPPPSRPMFSPPPPPPPLSELSAEERNAKRVRDTPPPLHCRSRLDFHTRRFTATSA